MLIDGQVARGGLGFGPIHRSRDFLIGNVPTSRKLDAISIFLEELEEHETAMQPG